jgi:hypothetical protein
MELSDWNTIIQLTRKVAKIQSKETPEQTQERHRRLGTTFQHLIPDYKSAIGVLTDEINNILKAHCSDLSAQVREHTAIFNALSESDKAKWMKSVETRDNNFIEQKIKEYKQKPNFTITRSFMEQKIKDMNKKRYNLELSTKIQDSRMIFTNLTEDDRNRWTSTTSNFAEQKIKDHHKNKDATQQ